MVTNNKELLEPFLKIVFDDSIGYRHGGDNVEFLIWGWFGEGYEKVPVSEKFEKTTVDKLLFRILQNYDKQLPSIHHKFPNYNWQKKVNALG